MKRELEQKLPYDCSKLPTEKRKKKKENEAKKNEHCCCYHVMILIPTFYMPEKVLSPPSYSEVEERGEQPGRTLHKRDKRKDSKLTISIIGEQQC